ncbi:MAG: serine/threonine protein kinase [Polyangiaceae bacterium]
MLAIATGCGRPFDVKTANGFVELENQAPDYDYRATTPDGVIMSIRAVDNDGPASQRGDIGFWERAVTLEMRDVQGYALLDAKDVTSGDGSKGRELHFGHDEDGKPYAYWVTLYLAQSRIYLVEAGGKKDLVDRAAPNLTWMAKNIHVQCNGLLSPVLESRTCNRW